MPIMPPPFLLPFAALAIECIPEKQFYISAGNPDIELVRSSFAAVLPWFFIYLDFTIGNFNVAVLNNETVSVPPDAGISAAYCKKSCLAGTGNDRCAGRFCRNG